MLQLAQMAVTVVCAVLASSGFWAYWAKKHDSSDAKIKLLVGLAHDRIMQEGMCYIERKYVTKDEYENLYDYLYKPYKELGGNGSAERIMEEVKKLPVYSDHLPKEETRDDSSREGAHDHDVDSPIPAAR